MREAMEKTKAVAGHAKVLPNFLMIGAQRCATTWLYFCLRQHPDVYLPFIKEIDFFSRYYDKGFDWYSRYFRLWRGQRAVGEITPSYLYMEGAAERIKRDLGEVRLIVCLRNPVDRAFSQYRKHLRAGAVHVDFEAALERNPEYVERGFYAKQLDRFLRIFPGDRILVMIYEDVKKDPLSHLERVFDFLEIDSSFVPACAQDLVPSEALGGGIYGPFSKISRFARHRMRLGAFMDFLKKGKLSIPLDRLFDRFGPTRRVPGDGKERPEVVLQPRTREYLASVFKNENQRLSDLLNRDFSFWD